MGKWIERHRILPLLRAYLLYLSLSLSLPFGIPLNRDKQILNFVPRARRKRQINCADISLPLFKAIKQNQIKKNVTMELKEGAYYRF